MQNALFLTGSALVATTLYCSDRAMPTNFMPELVQRLPFVDRSSSVRQIWQAGSLIILAGLTWKCLTSN